MKEIKCDHCGIELDVKDAIPCNWKEIDSTWHYCKPCDNSFKSAKFINLVSRICNEKFREFKELNDGIIFSEFRMFVVSDELDEVFEEYLGRNELFDATIGYNQEYNGMSIEFCYKGEIIVPKCNNLNLSMFDILKECVIQDTHKPNVKHLENNK